MTGCISGSTVCGVGNDGIITGGSNQCHVVEFFHVQQIVVFAFGNTLGKNAGNLACLQAHAITDKEDYVFSTLLGFFIGNNVVCLAFIAAILYFDSNIACFGKAYIVDSVNSGVAFHSSVGSFTKIFCGILTVNLYIHISGAVFYFNREIKFLSLQEFSIINRENLNSLLLRSQITCCFGSNGQISGKSTAHADYGSSQ